MAVVMSYLTGNHSIFATGGGLNRGSGSEHAFADPFQDIASTQMPTTMRSVLFWSEAIWTVMGTYRVAMERIVSYFLTSIEVSGELDEDERKKYMSYLSDDLAMMTQLSLVLRDRMCYGNAFCSVLVPFRRYLRQPHTGDFFPLAEVYNEKVFNFKFTSNFEFEATCPKTGWRGVWLVDDRPRADNDKIIFKRWSPHEIELLYDPYSGDVDYLWRIPEYYKTMVREGNLFHLERVSKQVLRAIKENRLFRFHRDAIYHLKEPTLAGLVNMGWGFPRSLTNFRQIWYVQVLRRYNEAIAMDYLVPLRLITPAQPPGTARGFDPLSITPAPDFKAAVRNMLVSRRKDPAGWHTLPFPVNYQMLGGDAKQLVPTELIENAYDVLLNETGTPVEFYRGSMTTPAHQAPMALRLFESTHWQIVAEANSLLQWTCGKLASILSWSPVKCMLQRVTLADDMQKHMSALQLMMSRELSGTAGLRTLGYDWETEQRRMASEARMQQELAARAKEEMDQAGFGAEVAKGFNPVTGAGPGGAPPEGGDPQQGAAGQPGAEAAMGAGNTPVSTYIQSLGPDVAITPQELQAVAFNMAQELFGLPEGVKDSELRTLKQYNPTLHAVVRQRMDAIRQEARNAGQPL
jgi:hypothetical protein